MRWAQVNTHVFVEQNLCVNWTVYRCGSQRANTSIRTHRSLLQRLVLYCPFEIVSANIGGNVPDRLFRCENNVWKSTEMPRTGGYLIKYREPTSFQHFRGFSNIIFPSGRPILPTDLCLSVSNEHLTEQTCIDHIVRSSVFQQSYLNGYFVNKVAYIPVLYEIHLNCSFQWK